MIFPLKKPIFESHTQKMSNHPIDIETLAPKKKITSSALFLIRIKLIYSPWGEKISIAWNAYK